VVRGTNVEAGTPVARCPPHRSLWPNRLIGDEQLPEDSDRNPDGTLKSWPSWLIADKPSPTGRYTFSIWRLWKKNDALLESGLLGPVKLIPAQRFEFRN